MENQNFKNSNLSQGVNVFSDDYMKGWRRGTVQDNTQNENRKTYNVDIAAIPFDGDNASKMISSSELCGIVADRMAEIFSDFDGCIIQRDNTYGAPYLLMYFKDKNVVNGDNRLKAIESQYANNNANNNLAARWQGAFGRGSKLYKLTDAGMDVLGKLVTKRYDNEKVNWNNFYSEKPDGNPYVPQNYSILVEIRSFDLRKVLAMVYGDKVIVKDPATDNNVTKQVYYDMSIIRPLTQMSWNTANINTNFLLNIVQLNRDNVQELAKKLGFGVVGTQGQIPMYRSSNR